MMKIRFLALLLLACSLSFAAYRWSVQVGGPISAPPLVLGNSVFAASYDGKIYSFSALDGKNKREYDFGQPIHSRLVPFSGMVAAAGGNSVALFDPSAMRPVWESQVSGRVDGIAASQDSLFVSTSTGVYSLGPDGQQRWKAEFNATHTAPALGGGLLLVGRGDEVVALSPEGGGQAWRQKLGSPVWDSSPAYFENRVFAGASDGKLYMLSASDGKLLQLSYADGREGWPFQADGWVATTPAFKGGLVIFGTSSGWVYSVSVASGSKTWSYKMPEGAFGSVLTQDVGSRSVALVPSMDGKLYAFDVNPSSTQGELLWSFSTAGGAGSPTASGQSIYFGSRDSHLYSITASPFCSITSPQDGMLVNEAEITVQGKAYSATGLSSLQIRINGGEWQDISPSQDWEYELDPSNYPMGKIQVECRSTDAAGQERDRYSSIALVRSAEAPLPEIEVALPQEIEARKPFFANVTRIGGKPLSDVYISVSGKSFSGSGSVEVTIPNAGRGTMTVSRKGYATKIIPIFARGSDLTLYAFVAVVILAAIATLFFLRFRRRAS